MPAPVHEQEIACDFVVTITGFGNRESVSKEATNLLARVLHTATGGNDFAIRNASGQQITYDVKKRVAVVHPGVDAIRANGNGHHA